MRRLFLTLYLAGVSYCTLASDLKGTADLFFAHCFDFGCKSVREIRYSEQQWNAIRQIFIPAPKNPQQEKQMIRRAIALMENISGAITGTQLDKGGNYPGYDIIKQMDCIDESTNTYQYLSALDKLKLLQWHQVQPKVRRSFLMFAHWTAVISEKTSKLLFAVDSWHRDNGEPPYIQRLMDWRARKDFPIEYNPD